MTICLRSPEEILLIKPRLEWHGGNGPSAAYSAKIRTSGVFRHFRRCAQYYALSGPETSSLAAKKQVRRPVLHDCCRTYSEEFLCCRRTRLSPTKRVSKA
jgi:hypothetical protein